MSIDALRRVLPPPATPVEVQVPRDGWEAVERSLGTALPEDYKLFLAIYGTGSVADFIWVSNPFSVLRPWFPWLSAALWAEHATAEGRGGRSPSFPLFPAPNGLLPWGHTDNGNKLFWVTEGAPADWVVLVTSPRGGTEDLVLASMSQFLTDICSGEYRCPEFPDDLVADEDFRPLSA
jgi:hypothetical protein